MFFFYVHVSFPKYKRVLSYMLSKLYFTPNKWTTLVLCLYIMREGVMGEGGSLFGYKAKVTF